MLKLCVILYVFFQNQLYVNCKFEEVFAWKQVDFTGLPINKINDLNYYNVSNVIPFGMASWKNFLFVACPRRRPGVPATLNIIDLTETNGNKSPPFSGYPNYELNDIMDLSRPQNERIVSVYRPAVDACNRLWFVDTGVLEYPSGRVVVQPASIWIIDLNTNNLLNRYEIPASMIPMGQGLTSITVDVITCDRTFAYVNDLFSFSLLVYSIQENRVWRFLHNYFYLDPLQGNFLIDGIKFMWKDGIFSIALGPVAPNGFRMAYFHSSPSLYEFEVSTEVLQNELLSKRIYHYDDFKLYGTYCRNHQSGNHVIDQRTGTVFINHFQLAGVGCYNLNRRRYDVIQTSFVEHNETAMIYPCHLNIDQKENLWLLTNNVPRFFYATLDPNQYNFRIWRTKVTDAINDGQCLSPIPIPSLA